MIRVTVIYRWEDGARFDHDYYHSKHMDIAREALSAHGLMRLESDRFFTRSSPSAGETIAAANAYFATRETAQAALAAAGPALMADLPNYSNLKPQVLLSAVTTHV